MRLNTKIILLVTLISTQHAFAEEITLKEFLENLRKNHPYIEAQRSSVEIAKFEKEKESSSEDWNLSAGARYRYREPSEIGIAVAERNEDLGVDVELQRKLWSTGGRFGVQFSDSLAKNKAGDSGSQDSAIFVNDFSPEKFYQKGLFINYTQPLLKNRGGGLDRLGFELKEFDQEIAQLRSLENAEQFLLSSGVTFIQWVELEAKRRILKKRVALAKKQLDQTSRMTKSGVKEDEDLFRAEESYWAAQKNLALTEANWQGLRVALSTLLGISDSSKFKAKFDLEKLHKPIDRKEIEAALENNSRVLRLLSLNKERSAKEIEGVEQEDQHQLDLELSAGLSGGDIEYDSDFGMDKPEAGVGLTYSRALGGKENLALKSRAEARSRQIEQEYQSQLIELMSESNSLVKRLELFRKVIKANKQQYASAVKRTKSEQRVYRQGRGELNFVIESQDSEQAAQFQLYEAAAQYQVLHLQLQDLLDRIFKEKDFS